MSQGLRFPGEWEPHEAVWIFWPTAAGKYLYGSTDEFSRVRETFVRLIDILAAFEPVRVGADPAVAPEARALIGRRAQVVEIPMDDAWARDTAPTFLLDGTGRAAVCWKFTGWGGRFGPIVKDAALGRTVAAFEGARVIAPELAMEGGGILSNGRGGVLTTAPVLHDPGRNQALPAGERSRRLAEALFAERVWELPYGFDGDDTGGHVDVVAAFSPDGAVLLNDCTDGDDPNSKGSRANARFLREHGFEVVAVPQPGARFVADGRLAYSYLNFFPGNGVCVVPGFGERRDSYVRDLIAERFPDREPVTLDARPFYAGGGGIHCVTQPVFRSCSTRREGG